MASRVINQNDLENAGFKTLANDWTTEVGRPIIDISAFPGFHGTGNTSDAAAIEAAIASFSLSQASDSEFAQGWARLTAPPGSIIGIDKSISIPYNLHIDFRGAQVTHLPGSGGSTSAFYNGFMFLLNSTLDGNQIVNYSGNHIPTISNAMFINKHGAIGGKAFFSHSKHGFKNIVATGLDKFYLKGSAGGYDYLDLIRFEAINFGKMTGTDWLIDIPYHGDGFQFDRVHCYIGSSRLGNPNMLRIIKNEGATIDACINGNYYFDRCSAVNMRGCHMEFGTLVSESSSVTVQDALWWVHPEALTAGYLFKSSQKSSDRMAGVLTLRNIDIHYIPDRSGIPQEINQPDFSEILLDNDSLLTVENAYRTYRSSTDHSVQSRTSIKVRRGGSSTPWDKWEENPSAFSKWSSCSAAVIETPYKSLVVPSTVTDNGISATSAAKWMGDTGTYYYRLQYLFGPKTKKVGITQTAEMTISLTNNSNAARVGFPRSLITNPYVGVMTIRIFRGTTAGSYDRYVDVGVGSDPQFIDTGFMLVTGEQWKSRTSGPVDSINSSVSKIEFDGNTATYYGTTFPQAGGISDGDVFYDTILREEWRRDGVNARWCPVSVRPRILKNSASTNIGSTYGNLIAVYDTSIAANRLLTLTAGSKIPGMIRKLVRTKTCTGAFTVSFTDSTTTWSLSEDVTKDQFLNLVCDDNGNWIIC